MRPSDRNALIERVEQEVINGARALGIVGLSPVTLRLLTSLSAAGILDLVECVYVACDEGASMPSLVVPVRPMTALSTASHDVLIVASDEDKEDLLRAAQPFVQGTPRVVLSGYAHLAFRDEVFREVRESLLVPSLANGYPHTLTHLYQCLANAARLGIEGVVAEFGMFKGGTTMFLSRVVERLGENWPVIGFDTFSGFPTRRSFLDMYDHPDCGVNDVTAVRRYLDGRDVEIVEGDIVETCHRLDSEQVVVGYVDTDNYTPARAVVEVLRDRTAIGGAIVFDHFTGVDRFCYTLGERIAAGILVDDRRYFNLHGTGVFYRQS